MTVHVVVPVFNRLAKTQMLVACLRKQRLNQPMRIWIVDDGSTDETASWLAGQRDVETLNGDGSLFWGGGVDLAFNHLKECASLDDWVLLMNNDTTVTEDFAQKLLDIAQHNAPAAVGCIVRGADEAAPVLSVGVAIDAWRFLTTDLLTRWSGLACESKDYLEVDALSGRGVLYPYAAIVCAGGMRPKVLPHYFADYELSMRVRKSGWRLLVAHNEHVYSEPDFGSGARAKSVREKFFNIRSPSYLPALVMFWWGASTWLQRVSMPIRLLLHLGCPKLRRFQA